MSKKCRVSKGPLLSSPLAAPSLLTSPFTALETEAQRAKVAEFNNCGGGFTEESCLIRVSKDA